MLEDKVNLFIAPALHRPQKPYGQPDVYAMSGECTSSKSPKLLHLFAGSRKGKQMESSIIINKVWRRNINLKRGDRAESGGRVALRQIRGRWSQRALRGQAEL